MQMYNNSIFIFHRSLRLHDNTGLIEALKNSKKVIPIFIFTTEQLDDKNNYKSSNCIQFMVESLDDLNIQLGKFKSRLFYFMGENQPDTLQKILTKFGNKKNNLNNKRVSLAL